jgi:hypothetical protein
MISISSAIISVPTTAPAAALSRRVTAQMVPVAVKQKRKALIIIVGSFLAKIVIFSSGTKIKLSIFFIFYLLCLLKFFKLFKSCHFSKMSQTLMEEYQEILFHEATFVAGSSAQQATAELAEQHGRSLTDQQKLQCKLNVYARLITEDMTLERRESGLQWMIANPICNKRKQEECLVPPPGKRFRRVVRAVYLTDPSYYLVPPGAQLTDGEWGVKWDRLLFDDQVVDPVVPFEDNLYEVTKRPHDFHMETVDEDHSLWRELVAANDQYEDEE